MGDFHFDPLMAPTFTNLMDELRDDKSEYSMQQMPHVRSGKTHLNRELPLAVRASSVRAPGGGSWVTSRPSARCSGYHPIGGRPTAPSLSLTLCPTDPIFNPTPRLDTAHSPDYSSHL